MSDTNARTEAEAIVRISRECKDTFGTGVDIEIVEMLISEAIRVSVATAEQRAERLQRVVDVARKLVAAWEHTETSEPCDEMPEIIAEDELRQILSALDAAQ